MDDMYARLRHTVLHGTQQLQPDTRECLRDWHCNTCVLLGGGCWTCHERGDMSCAHDMCAPIGHSRMEVLVVGWFLAVDMCASQQGPTSLSAAPPCLWVHSCSQGFQIPTASEIPTMLS